MADKAKPGRKRNRVKFSCLACGKEFEVPRSRALKGEVKYCSRECKYACFGQHMQKRILKTCPVCKQPFETVPSANNDYCSYTCAYSIRERRETRKCVVCTEPFAVKQSSKDICCSWECRVQRLRGATHPSWKGGSVHHYLGDWIVAKVQARKRDFNTCQYCGKSPEENGQNMSVHHIKPYRDFGNPEDANRLENLVCLCRSCHARQPE